MATPLFRDFGEMGGYEMPRGVPGDLERLGLLVLSPESDKGSGFFLVGKKKTN